MLDIVIYVSAFVGVASLIVGLSMLTRPPADTEMEQRLALLTTSGKTKEAAASAGVLARPLDSELSAIEEFVMRFFDLKLLLEQADLKLTPPKFLAICAILASAGTLITVAAGAPLWVAPLVGLPLAFLPLFVVSFIKKQRFAKFAKQLPDALELMSRALRAGHSLASGFHLVAEEMKAPIGTEFHRVFEEQNLGIPLPEALQSMAERVPNLDLRFFATAVVLQKQTGGDLAEILDKIGYIVRERFKIFGQVQALTGEGRLSGIVLLALPPALFAAVYRLNPDYVMPLFYDPLGRQMLAGGIVMQLLGAIVIRKIINIKV